MKITLLSYTGKCESETRSRWAAAELLLFTKSTRLTMSPSLLSHIMSMSETEKLKELEYMANTIPSSWEFVDYIFVVENVTRAFTHQFVRTRNASFAQQTMRVLNVQGFTYGTGPSIVGNERARHKYKQWMAMNNLFYKELIELGCEIEDARGVLPTNIHTNIVFKCNLRTLAEMALKRSSPRTQGEYRDVLGQIIDAVLEVHPWAKLFLRNRKIDAAKMLDDFIKSSFVLGGDPLSYDKIALLKAVDILRN